MKKLLKYTSLALAICTALVCLVACGNKSKTFTCDAGLTITLNDSFYEKDIVSQTFYLESSNVIFIALKEDFTTLSNAGYNTDTLTKSEYLNIVKQNNSLTADIIEDVENDLVYLKYYKNTSGKDFFYLALAEKGSDAFWLCQFACEQKNETEYTNQFIKWAKTIEVI